MPPPCLLGNLRLPQPGDGLLAGQLNRSARGQTIEGSTAGQFEISGMDGNAKEKAIRRELRRHVQIVFQDPYGSLNPRKKVGALLEEPLKINTVMNAAQRQERDLPIMTNVGLAMIRVRSAHVLRRSAPAYRHCPRDVHPGIGGGR